MNCFSPKRTFSVLEAVHTFVGLLALILISPVKAAPPSLSPGPCRGLLDSDGQMFSRRIE